MDADIIKDHLHWDPQNQSISADVPIGFTGEVKMWPMSTPPAGWLVCDGSLAKKADYPRLWRLLGDTWGTSTTTQFYVPNFKGRVPVGYDSTQTEFNAIAKTGGDKYMQAHSHLGKTDSTQGAASGWGDGNASALRSNNAAYTLYSQQTSTAGTGGSENLQPYAVLLFIIKA